ncbi:MAG: general secretion pathway protein GspK [Polyangiaceae bacterium]|nr:general secretion pathway protein GspK [Polyangiaceae bacterium]
MKKPSRTKSTHGEVQRKERSKALVLALARGQKRRQKRGIALVMVLGAITILTVFLTELQTDTTSAVAGALAERDRLKAEYYAKSAVNLSRLLLASEKPLRVKAGAGIIGIMMQTMLGTKKAPQIPIWEFSDLILGAFNGGDRASGFASKVGVDLSTGKNMGIPGNGYFELVLIDEDSKINVNTAAGVAVPAQLVSQLGTLLTGQQYAPIFENPDADGQQSDAATLCGALIDWADPDELATNCLDVTKPPSGSEDNIYQMLGTGYVRKNAPFDSLAELRLIRGMDDDRWATFVDPEPSDPHKRVLTIWGQDTASNPINVNTANPQVIGAVVCSVAPLSAICTDPLQAVNFLTAFGIIRSLARGVPLFPSYSSFKSALEGKGMVGSIFGMLGVPPVQFDPTLGSKRVLKKLFKSESKIFSVYATGVVPGTQREARVKIHAVIDMREAGAWGSSSAPTLDPNKPPASATTVPGVAADIPDDPNALVDEDWIKELKTNPFGAIVYYRVD